jgi:hypothetical protein
MITEKRCARCGATKPVSQFFRSKVRPDNCSVYCKTCQMAACAETRARHPHLHRRAGERWRQRNPDYGRFRGLYRRYGITRQDYEAMLQAQDGRCAICGSDDPRGTIRNGGEKSFSVDHCHETGKIRGLLCAPCNVAIGQLQHSEEILLSAIRYLKSSESC